MRPATKLVHGGQFRTEFAETTEPLFLTSGFVYDNAEQAEATFKNEIQRYQYSRFGNPTISMLETRLAMLEGAEACRTTATGMAAVNAALMSLVKTGDRVVASRALFGSCHWIVSTLLPRYGITPVFVDAGDLDQWRAALSEPAAAVLLESPSNPMLDVLDIRAISAIAHQAGAKVIVDNVFATALQQKPLELGADIVVYSLTKHADGQGRVLGGAVLGSKSFIEDTLLPFIRNTGPALSPFSAWIILKSLETLHLRVQAATDNAAAVADALAGHPKLARVIYPGRKDHPQYKLVQSQMSGGSTLVAIELKGGKKEAFAFMNRLKLLVISNNLADSKSMVTHPATTTHSKVSPEERARLGITDGAVRVSVGIEDPQDLIEDLLQALES